MTAAGMTGEGFFSIGSVLTRLKSDFADISISKIRFLESEGLISPHRTPSGYRQFSHADVQRLRYVLTAQRDQYLPLRVIKDQLDAIDRGLEPASPSPRMPRALVSADGPTMRDLAPSGDVKMTRQELLAQSQLSNTDLRELETYGLLGANAGGWFDAEAVQIASIVAELLAAGLEPRHLRPFRTAAEREAATIGQLVSAQARQRDPDARERAGAEAAQLATVVLRMHALLVKAALRRELGR